MATKKRKYTCRICGKKFTSPVAVKIHMQQAHPGSVGKDKPKAKRGRRPLSSSASQPTKLNLEAVIVEAVDRQVREALSELIE